MSSNEKINIDIGDTNAIDDYVQRKNTSVLVIMFTDIKGFTQITEEKGDEYAIELREHHDDIIREAIEAEDAGLVIKTIGDAFMAVFSEPIMALKRALLMQERLREFNEANKDKYDELQVRIGMHIGQIVVENKIQLDVFGRHVNRASRVEGLADGGQVYLTYPVFDSAKGWLTGKETLGWKNHGQYYVKGIGDPIEIYEVFHKEKTKPVPPKGGRKKTSLPKWTYLLLFLAIGAGLAYALLSFNKTEANLELSWTGPLYIDSGKRIYLEKIEGTKLKRPKEPLSAEKHLLYYDASKVSRFWTVVDIKRGKNNIKPKFNRIHLPGAQVNASYRYEKKRSVSLKRKYSYVIPDADYKPKTIEAVIEIDAKVDKNAEGDVALFTIDWACSLQGKQIGGGQIIDKNSVSNKRGNRDPVIFYEDDFHYFFIKYSLVRDNIQFEIKSQYNRYKK